MIGVIFDCCESPIESLKEITLSSTLSNYQKSYLIVVSFVS